MMKVKELQSSVRKCKNFLIVTFNKYLEFINAVLYYCVLRVSLFHYFVLFFYEEAMPLKGEK